MRGSFKLDTSFPSESRQVGKRKLALVYVHVAKLSAAVQGRKYLAGIERAGRIEGTLEVLLLCEAGGVKHLAHQVALLFDLSQGRVRWMRERAARALPQFPADLPGQVDGPRPESARGPGELS